MINCIVNRTIIKLLKLFKQQNLDMSTYQIFFLIQKHIVLLKSLSLIHSSCCSNTRKETAWKIIKENIPWHPVTEGRRDVTIHRNDLSATRSSSSDI